MAVWRNRPLAVPEWAIVGDRTGFETVEVGERPAAWGYEFLNSSPGAPGEEPFAMIEGMGWVRVQRRQNPRFGRKPVGKRECRADGTESVVRSEIQDNPGREGKPAKHSCMVVLEETTPP
jgi:hypothetical protein